MEIPFGNSIEFSRRYPSLRIPSRAGDIRLARNQAASSNACIIERRWCTVLSMLVLILINRVHARLLSCSTSKRSTHKVISYRLLRHHFTQCV